MRALLGAVLSVFLLVPSVVLASEIKIEKKCVRAEETVSAVSSPGKRSVLKCRVEVRSVCPFFLKNVRVKVSIPRGTKYISGSDSPTLWRKDGKTYIVWTIPHLAPAEEKVFHYRLTVEK